jgi:cytochrome c2
MPKRLLISAMLMLVLGGLAVAQPKAPSLVMKRRGKVVRTFAPGAIEKLAVDVRVRDVETGKARVFRAVPVASLFGPVYGKSVSTDDVVVFTCTDGYQPAVAAPEIMKGPAFLAFASADGQPFETKSHDGTTPLGPFYLVWDNSKETHDWPYQVVSIDLVGFAQRYPKLMPPKSALPAAKRGFSYFRARCMKCHALNGEGGTKAPELNTPVSVTRYWRTPWLARFIDDPQKVRAGSQMPRIEIDPRRRSAAIDDIIRYLEAMARP